MPESAPADIVVQDRPYLQKRCSLTWWRTCSLALATACLGNPVVDDTGAPRAQDDTGAPCELEADGNDSAKTASSLLPLSLDYIDPGPRAHLTDGDVDWYVASFGDTEWQAIGIEPDDPSALEILATVYDEDFEELDSSTEGVSWGYSDPDYPNNPGPVTRYLRAVASSGCGTYGFWLMVL